MINLLVANTLALLMSSPSTTIWSAAPATHFYESCVLGNGRLGAMVFGGVGHERVVLNESTMWSGSPQDGDRHEAYKVLPQIRELLLKGDNSAANDLVQSNFVCAGPGSGGAAYGCYQTFGDLIVDSPEGEFSDYRRTLDLDRAVATISYRSRDTKFTREAFTSAPAQVLVYRYRADHPGKINFTAKLARPERAASGANGSDFTIEGNLDSGNPSIPGVGYLGRLRVVAKGGHTSTDLNGIHVTGADEATLIFSAGTDMFSKEYRETVKSRLDSAASQNVDRLAKAAEKDHQKYFRRVQLNLPEGPSAHKPTLERMIDVTHGSEDPSLGALYFNFGRYLVISGSRPDSPLPTNLQGIWAEELHTPWNGDFHLDINLQMNYWPVQVTNLADCAMPLIKFVPRLVPNGEKTAKSYFNARGWTANTISNPWLFTSPGEGAGWGCVSTAGAWLCQNLWSQYDFTRDRGYLQHIYPTLRGSAEFFLDSLVAEPKHGWLVTAPSTSPENSYVDPASGRHLSITAGSTFDLAVIRGLFENVIEASKILNTDAEFRGRVEAALAKLAPYQIGSHGQLQEWLQDYEETEVHHRHLSPLYGLYPGNSISPTRTPELAQAVRKTLERRGDEGLGWSYAWKSCLAARLGDGEHAWKLIKLLLHPATDTGISYTEGGGAYPNLLDTCPPFQIDGNFGGTAGIAEMLVQSENGSIHIAPALPKAWRTGSVKGLRARGGFTVDFSWADGIVTDYTIQGRGSNQIQVVVPKGSNPKSRLVE